MPAPHRAPYLPLILLAFAAVTAFLLIAPPAEPPGEREDEPGAEAEREGTAPSDWFFAQRAYPHADVDPVDLARMRAEAAVLRATIPDNVLPWDPVGPTHVGGRIADLAVDPHDPLTVYVGAAEGGVLKTIDGGVTWTPLFDDRETLSIGDLAIHPNDGNILYVGTGEPNGGGGSVTYGGNGVYKTTNGGVTWTNVGLEATRYIGRVVIDPVNPDRIFVAAMGSLFSTNPERGVYRSTDAGATWEHVLAVTDSTGAVDLVIDPTSPNRVYAATWERIRRPHMRRYGGPTSAIYRSTNGGDTWAILGGGLPSPAAVNGRIGLALSLSNPLVLYAIYADQIGNFAGVYKTTNGGDTWTRTSDGALAGFYSSYGWWFGNIRVEPTNPDRVYALGLTFYRSTNGGASWSQNGSNMHVDHHAMEFAPTDAGLLFYEGNDGGLYRTTNGGSTWTEITGLPITQFYTAEVDYQFPNRRYGGTQDNGTIRTLSGFPSDWAEIYGGDGFHVNVDYTNNSYVYAESQYGGLGRSTNGGSSFVSALNGISGSDRMNWSTPVVLNPTDPAILYFGSQRVYRSTNRAVSWTSISPDLSDGIPGQGGVIYSTVTTIAAAPTNPLVIYAGTDDANVWVTQNGGTNWTRIDAALPERWVTRVAVDPVSAATAYVTLSGFRDDDPLSHVFRTTDYGATWTAIASNLPEAPANDLIVDPDVPGTLYVATDVGVYETHDLGGSWAPLGLDLPNVVITALELHRPSRILTAATFGRSMFAYDLGAAASVETMASAPPMAPRLLPASPNPMTDATTLTLDLPGAADATLRIYDITGRLVRELAATRLPAGRHEFRWDGRDSNRQRVARGVYLARLEADQVVRTRKVSVTR